MSAIKSISTSGKKHARSPARDDDEKEEGGSPPEKRTRVGSLTPQQPPALLALPVALQQHIGSFLRAREALAVVAKPRDGLPQVHYHRGVEHALVQGCVNCPVLLQRLAQVERLKHLSIALTIPTEMDQMRALMAGLCLILPKLVTLELHWQYPDTDYGDASTAYLAQAWTEQVSAGAAIRASRLKNLHIAFHQSSGQESHYSGAHMLDRFRFVSRLVQWCKPQVLEHVAVIGADLEAMLEEEEEEEENTPPWYMPQVWGPVMGEFLDALSQVRSLRTDMAFATWFVPEAVSNRYNELLTTPPDRVTEAEASDQEGTRVWVTRPFVRLEYLCLVKNPQPMLNQALSQHAHWFPALRALEMRQNPGGQNVSSSDQLDWNDWVDEDDPLVMPGIKFLALNQSVGTRGMTRISRMFPNVQVLLLDTWNDVDNHLPADQLLEPLFPHLRIFDMQQLWTDHIDALWTGVSLPAHAHVTCENAALDPDVYRGYNGHQRVDPKLASLHPPVHRRRRIADDDDKVRITLDIPIAQQTRYTWMLQHNLSLWNDVLLPQQ